ncbi:hypothetical protein [Phytohabitans houttuyneae]|uniref:hypothetical protein n=1 Tax=Phytohabitans houttuyneae TaxID=1076126 RepID=UPI00353126CF
MGLAAKPIIDISAVVPEVCEIAADIRLVRPTTVTASERTRSSSLTSAAAYSAA